MEDIVSYRTLEKEFYANSSSDRYTAHDALLSKRFDSDSTFKTGIALSTGELFLAVPRELSIATEHVLRRERRVSALWRALPPSRLEPIFAHSSWTRLSTAIKSKEFTARASKLRPLLNPTIKMTTTRPL